MIRLANEADVQAINSLFKQAIAYFKNKGIDQWQNGYPSKHVIKKDIKDREIELYRNFQKELASMPKINCKINNAYAVMRSRRNYKELARR